MRRIAIINQKGGVGKTTTAVNLAAALALAGQRVCVLDLDPQAHATTHLGVQPDGKSPSMYDVLIDGRPLAEVRRIIADNLCLLGSDINLAAAEVELAGVVGREVILRDALLQETNLAPPLTKGGWGGSENPVESLASSGQTATPPDPPFVRGGETQEHDFILMDCAPSLGVLTLNALAAADEVFIPLQPHFLALHGMGKLLETTALVAKRINPALRVTGIILCMYESTTKLSGEVIRDLQSYLDKSRSGSLPWAQAQIFETRIRRNIKLAEAPSFGQTIFAYAPSCHGSEDYAALAAEVMKQGSSVLAMRVSVDEPASMQRVQGSGIPLLARQASTSR